jgi:3-dehydroquinate synthase
MCNSETVTVDLGNRGYDIVIGEGVLAQSGAIIANVLGAGKAVVVTDETVASLHLGTLERSLEDAGIPFDTIILPPGEHTKDFSHFERLLNDLLDLQIDRASMLIALGGGVIGDIVGFAAAVALRGIDFIQVPTTLLAQVDSSVGGKTAIDMPQGKNLVGAFHQPRLVLADMGVLDTLPHREVLAGYAEVVKYGLIEDAPFFEWLEENGVALVGGDMAARRIAVVKCCEAKARIVAEDERESGRRALLNFGHTFGHALEAETEFGDVLLHGEAVALGMAIAFDLSVALEHCSSSDADRVHRHFSAIGLECDLNAVGQGIVWDPQRLLAHMASDKKAIGGRKTFILVRKIGDAFVSRDVEDEPVITTLSRAIAA